MELFSIRIRRTFQLVSTMVGTDLHNLETFGKWIGNVRLTDKLAREIMSLR